MPLPIALIEVPAGPTPRAGLLTVATGPMPLDEHAQHGAQYEAAACTDARLYPVACSDSPYPAVTYDAREAMNTAYAFNVYASEICPPVGTSFDESISRVKERLRIGEQTAVEKALWGGAAGVTGVFESLQAAGKVTAIAGVPPNGVVESLSLLENTASGFYDGPLIVHARPRMAAYFGSRGVFDGGIRKNGPLVEIQKSHFGSMFSFGAGYSGNTPAGGAPDATTETVYITGRVLVWRTEVVTPRDRNELLDIRNQRSVFAMRTYAIAVECVAAAITVTRAS